LILLFAEACNGPARLIGTDLGNAPAPDFQLQDQSEANVSLAGLRGRVVALTFWYTSCPDICPLTAAKLADAYGKLSDSERQRTAILAITVDPARDTADRRAAFARVHGLEGALKFLSADKAQLAPIWQAYYVGVEADSAGTVTAATNTIGHTSATYLIDQAGRERVLITDPDLEPSQLAQNFRVLLNEQPRTNP
jgi:protein SCO1/2